MACPANAAAVAEQGGECPVCGEPASAHRDDDSDPMAAVFNDEEGEVSEEMENDELEEGDPRRLNEEVTIAPDKGEEADDGE